MKINDVMRKTYIQTLNNNKVSEVKAVNPVQKVQNQDQIQLSQASRDILRYAEAAKNSEVNSSEQVSRIKNQLANGTYDISSGKIARGMIEKMK